MSMTQGVYSRLDHAMAEFLGERCGLLETARHRFQQLVLDLSAAQAAGHSCLLVNVEEHALLSQSPLVSARDNTPLILEGERLYLQRYWEYESCLVANIVKRIRYMVPAVDKLPSRLDHYFPPQAAQDLSDPNTHQISLFPETEEREVDWQRLAAAACVTQAFNIITGGPGTGKTTTVLKILTLLQEVHAGSLTMLLAAPTGKAAMRLQQSLREGKQGLVNVSPSLLDAVPDTVSTLHRLLGPIHHSTQFRHDAAHPLNCDVLVVDEASMIDLAMMSKLVSALRDETRLILLGDQDQLASVESGAVLSDLCLSLPQQTLQLKKTWRFSGPIKNLADAVNQQQARLAWNILLDETQHSVSPVLVDPISAIAHHYQPYLDQVKHSHDPRQAFDAFASFQVLAALRRGERGVEGLNHALEKHFQSQQLATYQTWYHGRPVMISRNDPQLGLFNGDIGLCLYDPVREQMQVWFEQADGELRPVMPGRLPAHETVYAMTIHKSQGSEFAHVMIVLPAQASPLLSKELLYTAITRAKSRVDIVTSEAIFLSMVQQPVQRYSGLPDKIRQTLS